MLRASEQANIEWQRVQSMLYKLNAHICIGFFSMFLHFFKFSRMFVCLSSLFAFAADGFCRWAQFSSHQIAVDRCRRYMHLQIYVSKSFAYDIVDCWLLLLSSLFHLCSLHSPSNCIRMSVHRGKNNCLYRVSVGKWICNLKRRESSDVSLFRSLGHRQTYPAIRRRKHKPL